MPIKSNKYQKQEELDISQQLHLLFNQVRIRCIYSLNDVTNFSMENYFPSALFIVSRKEGNSCFTWHIFTDQINKRTPIIIRYAERIKNYLMKMYIKFNNQFTFL